MNANASRPTSMTPNLVLCELADPGVPGLESYSPFCLKVHRALGLARLPYARRHGAGPRAFLRLNPTGQVPVLLVDGEPVADSTRILARLVTYAGGAIEAGPEAWLWEAFADDTLNGFLVAARWADPRNWPAVRDAYFAGAPWPVRRGLAPLLRRHVLGALHARDVTRAGLDVCWERFTTTLDHLEARTPERGFWLGARASVADVALFGQLRSFVTDLTPWQRDAVRARARLSDYLARVDAATAPRATVSAPVSLQDTPGARRGTRAASSAAA